MDFTEIYKQTASLVSFSPGTHFLLTAVQDRLIVRRSDSFQIARTWLVDSTPSPTSAALSSATVAGPSSLRDRSGDTASGAWITHAGWSCDSDLWICTGRYALFFPGHAAHGENVCGLAVGHGRTGS